MLSLEHIDPRKGALVSGLENEFNEIIADLSYNSRKGNRFLPYRVCNYSAPTTFGDIGEFLVEGEWVVCEFGGSIWWKETNRVGCNAMARAYAPASNRQRKEAQKVGLSNRGRTHTLSPENKEKQVQGAIAAGKASKGRMWFVNKLTGETKTAHSLPGKDWKRGRKL